MTTNNYVAVLPTEETKNYLKTILSSAPFDVRDGPVWHIPVLVSDDSIDESLLEPMRVYTADPVSVELWYDAVTNRSDLVVAFNSTDLKRRHLELKDLASVNSLHGIYVPALALVYGFPPLSSASKSFINSLNATLWREDTPLTFTAECLLDSSGYVPHQEGMKFFSERLALLPSSGY